MAATNGTKQQHSSAQADLNDDLKKVFNKFDSNGDGRISKSELIKIMEALGSNPTQDEIDRVMKDIDTDSDGFINLEEFASFLKAGTVNGDGDGDGDGDETELREAFDLYDQDKDGKISAEELLQILTRLGEKCTVQDTAKMIESVDSDGDGFVNFDEFKKMMTNNKTEESL